MKAKQANTAALQKMTPARLLAFACALVLSCLMLVSHADAQEDARPAPAPSPRAEAAIKPESAAQGKSTLRGHVSYENTGRPVRRARLMLISRPNHGSELTGVTNSRGDFQIKNVPEGKYFIMVDAAGIVTPLSLVDLEKLNNDQLDYEQISKLFEEVSIDGINDKEVEVRAHRGGAISGRVTYQDGDPAINVHVTVMRRKNGELKQFLTSISPSAVFGNQTDDRGFYRFSGLPPGEYVLGATENIEHGDVRHNGEDDFMSAAMFGGTSLVMTYYRDATSARNATSIQIEAGEEEKNVDITLVDRPLHVINGTVRSRRDNRPLAHAQVSLSPKENNQLPNQVMPASEFQPNSETDEMGQWSFNEIPDGNYVITVQPAYEAPEPSLANEESQPAPARLVAHNRKKLSLKRQDLKVAGHDVTDLVIEMTEGVRVSGTVTVEGGKPFPEALFVSAQSSDEETEALAPAFVNPNGRFVMDGLPGGKLSLFVYTPDGKYYAKSIFSGGLDLTREPLVVQESAEIKDVRIVISADTGTLTGRVLSAPGGAPLSHTRITLYPADPALWTRPGRVIFGDTDNVGEFSVSGAPGEYLFVVAPRGDKPKYFNEEYVKSRAATATHVTLQANEQKSVEIIAPGAR